MLKKFQEGGSHIVSQYLKPAIQLETTLCMLLDKFR